MEPTPGPTQEELASRITETLASATERLKELAVRSVAYHQTVGGDREEKIQKLQAFKAVIKFFQELVESGPAGTATASAWLAGSGCINPERCRELFITSPFAIEARVCTEYVIRRMALVCLANPSAFPAHRAFYQRQLRRLKPHPETRVAYVTRERRREERARYHIDGVDPSYQ